jgi:hypothetical protein
MDKELISMCDCEEVQKMWKPKDGDQCVLSSEPELVGIEIADIWMHGHFRDDWEGITDDEQMELGRQSYKKDYLFIPRIEDVLEWLGNRFTHLMMSGGHWVVSGWNQYNKQDEEPHVHERTPIKALLALLMHIKHNKTWDGNQWNKNRSM